MFWAIHRAISVSQKDSFNSSSLEIIVYIWSIDQVFRLVEGIWLHRKIRPIRFFWRKKTYFTSYARYMFWATSYEISLDKKILSTLLLKKLIYICTMQQHWWTCLARGSINPSKIQYTIHLHIYILYILLPPPMYIVAICLSLCLSLGARPVWLRVGAHSTILPSVTPRHHQQQVFNIHYCLSQRYSLYCMSQK